MKHKIDPRTGRVVEGQRAFKPQVESPPPRKKANPVPQQPAQQMDLDIMMKMATEIGKAIAAELKSLSVQTPVAIQQPVVSEDYYCGDGLHPQYKKLIDIDDGIIDVGHLDKSEGLEKGEGAGTLGKEEAAKDTSLSSSKSKLQALIGGKK